MLVAVGVANSATTTVTYQVSASADDGYALIANKGIQDTKGSSLISLLQAEEAYSTFYTESETTPNCDGWAWDQGQQTLDGNSLYIGTNNRDYFVPYPISAMKFSMLGIFRGMEVISANFRIYTGDEMNDGRVYGVIHGGLPGWPYVFQDISQIEKTQASVDWDHIDAWEPNSWYYSPGLTNIVQELINKPDWKAGHPMTMVYSTRQKSPGMRSFLSSERGYTLAPKLRIRFRACVIFGYVRTAEGEPIQWATIDGGDDLEKRISSSDGSYQFFVPPGWSGTLTVSKNDILFKPAQYTYTNLNTHMYEQNFIEYKPKISGFILDKYGKGLEQANISANNGGASGVSDANGFYEIMVPLDWSGTVTVNKPGWEITPHQVSYSNLVTDQNYQDYSAYQPTISGHINDEEGLALEGVQVDIEGVGALLTDPDGQYQIDVPYMWSGKITASMTDWGFLPYYRSHYSLTTDKTNQDFTSFQPKISGYVRKSDGSAIVQATVQASNGGPSAVTNYDGYYEITVPYYWSGVISISKDQMPFTPEERTYFNITANLSNQNYTLIDPKISGYVRRENSSAVASVTVQASNGGGSVVTDSDGYYKLTVPYNWFGVVTPNKVGCTFDPVNRSYTDVTADLSNQDYLTTVGIIYVKQDGSGDFTTIQAAIDAAVDGHTIIVATGTYTGDGNRDIDFKGKAITVRGETGDPNDCIIDCQGTETDPHRGFKFISEEDANSVLEAITITNGYGPKEDPDENGYEQSVGGAVYSDRSSPTIQNCKFVNNSVTVYGGGIYNYLSYSTIINCLFTGNSASSGGGVFNWKGRTIISNCDFENNSVNSGAGIYNHICSPEITKCIFTNNNADYYGGGGITNYVCSPKVRNCVFANNSAKYGGGIHNRSSNAPEVTNCIFINNTTISGGGIYNASYYCRSDVKNCIIWNNTPNQIYGSSTVTYSNIQGGWTGQGNINADPELIDDYHISTNSPCIDAGDPDYIPDINETDIDGDPRVVVRIDIGPDEVFSRDSALILLPTNTVDFLQFGLNETVSSQIIQFKNYGVIDLNWHISNDCTWLIINPLIGATESLQTDEVTISIDNNNIDYGLQTCQFRIMDPNAENSPQTVTVNLDVLGPTIQFSPQSLVLEQALSDSNNATSVLSIANSGYDTLNWQIQIPPDCHWLNAEPMSGQSTDEIDEVTLSADANRMDIGFYTCELTISDPNAENSPQIVPVTLHVHIPGQIHIPTEYSSIQDAVDAAGDGDEMIIHPGVYQQNKPVYVRDKAVTIRSIDPNDPRIVGATVIEGYGFDFSGSDSNEVELQGLTIRGFSPWDYLNRPYSRGVGCFESSSLTIYNCVVSGHSEGIRLYYSDAKIIGCTVKGNGDRYYEKYYGSAIQCSYSNVEIRNCIISNNEGFGISADRDSNVDLVNCTIVDNKPYFAYNEQWVGGGVYSYGASVSLKNSILWNNHEPNGFEIQISNYPGNEANSVVEVSYSDVEGGKSDIYIEPNSNCVIVWGEGNIDTDPCFAESGYWHMNDTPDDPNDDFWVDGNYHLKSQAGRWKPSIYIGLDPTGDGFINLVDFSAFASYWKNSRSPVYIPQLERVFYPYVPADFDDSGIVDLADLRLLLDSYLTDYNIGQWVTDDVTSPCIDAGDPNSDWTPELWPHGKRINMGAFGGTPEAGMSLSNAGNIADLNTDGFVDYADMMLFTNKWVYQKVLLSEDLDRNGFVNSKDFAIFANEWLWEE